MTRRPDRAPCAPGPEPPSAALPEVLPSGAEAATVGDAVPPLFAARFVATADAVRLQLARLEARCGAARLAPERTGDLLIVLSEILNNAVEHGTEPPRRGTLAVAVRRDGGILAVECRDDGRPLPAALLRPTDGPAVDGPFADMPEGGFGWAIIHDLAADLRHVREGGWNRLSFRLPG
ncbi:ATP-binding protein [Jannaschia sp. W003]|uniref:ATP-binding protein n=1 Tax=Jannaschia sp. W003 TaxID=2867012 RepID=UPI0021A71127|nr:ATP-binding protein [Jannaschia sp. W003]UWQ21444.1 ATP-binding protein [Jannaschia sp. W003]